MLKVLSQVVLGAALLIPVFSCSGSENENNAQQGGVHGNPDSGLADGGVGPGAHGNTPVCGEACADPRGCFPCSEGAQTIVGATEYVCVGGCWMLEPTEGPTCQRFGRDFYPGQQVPDALGCNECRCDLQMDDAAIGCSTIACPCDDITHIDFRYTAPSECESAEYTCPPNTEPVNSICGCGCAQDPRCAEIYDCTDGCEAEVIREYCPFSVLLNE